MISRCGRMMWRRWVKSLRTWSSSETNSLELVWPSTISSISSNSPYYVYQYATCFASSAKLFKDMTTGDAAAKQAATERYLTLLKSGGNDHPMAQLKKAGVDLTQRATVQAVVDQLDELVTRMEAEAAKIR